MKIDKNLADDALLRELGGRLTSARLSLNLTQAALAEEAGISKRTLERLESGEVATQLSSFLRVCRVLGLVERFESLVPAATPSPMAQLKLAGKQRQRAKGRRGTASNMTGDLAGQERAAYALSDDVDAQAKTGAKKWTWADK